MLINNNEYFAILDDIKTRIKTAQYEAVLGANKELLELYWSIGKIIIANTKYGTKFIENISRDILSEFPNIQGFSVRNLIYMRKFAEINSDFQKMQRGVALLPWRNNITLMSKVKDENKRQWYTEQNIENSWNNTDLTHHKNTEFKPEYAGKLNFYLSAIDDILKHETDNPSIGIMLCRTRDKLTAEYALKDINKPIGVSEYKLSDFVPAELADTLPSVEDIEKRVRLKYDIKDDEK